MYAPFFGLQQEAFSIAPDPRFLHLSAGHREALAHLLYGLQGGGGFVLLTGEIGAGKTTVCQEFGVEVGSPPPATTKPYVDALKLFLLDTHARGEQGLLVVDEAQGLSIELLELLRLLTNLETQDRKLLQIVLIGQPELRELLARPELEQLSQRVIARVHLGPLDAAETAAYVQHRLAVAGLQGAQPFEPRALALVHRLSGGVPRRINLLCQRALLGAYAHGRPRIDAAIVRQAAREAFDAPAALPPRGPALAAALLATLVVAMVAGGAWWWRHGTAPAGRTAAAAAEGAASAPALATELQPWPDAGAATTALAAAWGLQAPAADEPCRAARTLGLACHEGRLDLALLRRLDRPLLLSLDGDGGWLLLHTLGAHTATVQGAGGEQRVSLALLQSRWGGAAAAWWRPPAGDTPAWVLAQLVALQGPESPAARVSPDEALRRRVFAFQVGQGLPLDGLAGPLTLMQLNRASGVDEPRLRPEP